MHGDGPLDPDAAAATWAPWVDGDTLRRWMAVGRTVAGGRVVRLGAVGGRVGWADLADFFRRCASGGPEAADNQAGQPGPGGGH